MTKESYVKIYIKRRTRWLTYHDKVLFQGHEKVWLPYVLESFHVLGQEEGPLQCLGDVGRVPSLELLNGGVPRDGSTINL